MSNPFIVRYKIPMLFSIVVALAILILPGNVTPVNAVLALVGAIIGFLLIDLEYVVHAYVVDPSSDVSMRIREFIHMRNFSGLIDFYNREEYTFGELSVRSAMFQIILAVMALMTITNQSWILARALALSMSINLLYFQFQEFVRTGTLQRWFWVFNGELHVNFYKLYMLAILFVFLYPFTFL